MQTLNYEEFGLHRLSLNWSGKEECENKYFNLDKIVVNQQKVPVHTIRSKPHENDYIKGLRKTDAGRNMLKQISLYPGYRHGWYGDYDIDFLVGDNQYFKKLSKESIQVFLGIKKERIYVDKDYQHSYHTV